MQVIALQLVLSVPLTWQCKRKSGLESVGFDVQQIRCRALNELKDGGRRDSDQAAFAADSRERVGCVVGLGESPPGILQRGVSKTKPMRTRTCRALESHPQTTTI